MAVTGSMAFFHSSGFHYKEVHFHGDRSKPLLSLTFDDGPSPATTPVVLDVLKKHKVKATFFIIGKNIGGNEEVLRRILGEGHLIGNHSWSHSVLWDFLPARRMAADLVKNIAETERITGKRMKLFRPPYGVINPMLARAIGRTGLNVIGWSFRSFDTTSGSAESLLSKTIIKVRPGDILLFHDSSELTAGILEKIIVSLQDTGFGFIPLDEMLKLQAYENL